MSSFTLGREQDSRLQEKACPTARGVCDHIDMAVDGSLTCLSRSTSPGYVSCSMKREYVSLIKSHGGEETKIHEFDQMVD
jgi:hypothetical protein